MFWTRTLGFTPNDLKWYEQAMRHSSVCQQERKPSNERLEFVGDAMLSAIVGDILFQLYPKQREGFLTATRSKLVKRDTLNAIARALKLNKMMRLAPKVNRSSRDIYGNAFEALVGAIYYDQGYQTCYDFVKRIFFTSQVVDLKHLQAQTADYKSDLYMHAQHIHADLRFEHDSETVEKNRHTFHVTVYLNDERLAVGTGRTKREAEQLASRHAISHMKKTHRW